jgi:Effector Associated Constant Component 1
VDELELRIDAGDDAGAEQVDRLVRGLRRDLRALGMVRVEHKAAVAPDGAMAGVAQELGVLVASGVFTTTTVRAVSNVVVAYVQRSKARAVEWEFDGAKGTFTALSRSDQHALVETVAARIAAGAPRGEGAPGAGEGGAGQEGGASSGGEPDRTADRD